MGDGMLESPAGEPRPRPRIGAVTPAASPAAVRVLSRAFRDNPLNRAVIGGDEGLRLRSTRHGMRASLAACGERCTVLGAAHPGDADDRAEDADFDAVLIAAAPFGYPMPRPPVVEQLRWLVGQGWRIARRWARVHRILESVHPLEPHWYLAILGVEPERQGNGVGSALLSAWLERVDVDPMPCYLETDRPENVAFYGRAGFSVEREIDVLGVPVWCMWRPSR